VRTKDSCWCVGTIYDPTELPGVSTAGPGIGRSVTSGIRTDPRGFTGVCGLGGSSIWRMWARSGHMAMTALDIHQNRPSQFYGRVWARGFGYMAHVGSEWSHGI
jgi:hypothetical protein